MAALYWQRRPTYAAAQWTGDNADEMTALAGADFAPLADGDDGGMGDPTATAKVHDTLRDAWLPVHTGDWIVQGSWGEWAPCTATAFAAGYEPAT